MKKFFAMLMAMIMMLPSLGMAASPAELLEEAWNAGRTQTVQVTVDMNDELLAMIGDETETTVVSDLLDAVALTFAGGQQGLRKVALNLSGSEVLNLLGETVDDVHYVGSTLLGADVLAANEEELIVIGDFLVQSMADEGMVTEEDAQMLQMLLAMLPEMADELAAQMPADADVEIDVTPVTAVLEQWKSEAAPVTELTDMGGLCDAPASGLKFVLDKDDLLAMLDAYFEVMCSVPGFLEGMSAAMEGGDPEAELAALQAELAEELKDEDVNVYMTILYDAEEQPVYAIMTMEIDEDEGEPASVIYSRSTVEEGVEHLVLMTIDDGEECVDLMVEVLADSATQESLSIVMDVQEDDETIGMLSISWRMDKNYQELSATENGVFAVVVADEEGEMMNNFGLVFDVEATKTGEDVACQTNVQLVLDDVVLGTLYVDTQTGDPLPSLTEGNVVRLGQMISAADVENPQDPLYAYFETMAMNAMVNLVTVLQSLPMSVLTLMME